MWLKKPFKKSAAKKQPAKAADSFKKTEKVEVKICKPVFGKYGVVAEVGHVKKVHLNQAKEMVQNGDAEYV